ncbi:MAG: hypothetical protein P1P82_07630 [Bacteroidales bacterium]|nr:hypothetical protein [Bacteroidales bacterium]
MMEIREIKASEIVDFANQVAASTSPVLPVTPWRAGSQAENPDARPDDLLLIVAIGNAGQIAGYIGLLPFQLSGNETERISWNTCWWVAPGAGAGVSLSLFSRFLKVTGNRVAFSDMTEKTAGILRRLQGYHVASRTGMAVRFRHAYNKRIRTSRKAPRVLQVAAVTGIFRLADGILNTGRKKRTERWLREHPAPCRITVSRELHDTHVDFAREHSKGDITLPSIKRFNWWRDHPWLVPPDSYTRRIARRYYFSALAVHNELFIPECTCNDVLAGFAIISNRDGVLKTHYLYFRSDSEQAFYQSLLNYLITIPGSHTLVSFHEGFAGFVEKQKFPAVHARKATRYTALSLPLEETLENNTRFRDGDGDYIFT